ncbi:protein ZNF365-like isoform X2 [Varanus komodoensis]|uniref:FBX41/ZN365 C2H2-type zinc finger domain-containing protein n=1 Tax=Varanus komodoensis TaxID=61221 RepID=A0A8D2LPH8_VARKO|nr:protein ZNF365-like isoform X2 [Varanus komodoensis]XP_044276002.1 protein ZNF365-like isoform X2 [Varanus komodoensis]
MQQNTFEESRYPWQESFENVSVCLPFRCPRCGDHTRFRTLSSLRAHLEYNHSYEDSGLLTKCSLFSSLKDTDLIASSEPLMQGDLGDSTSIVKPKLSYLNFCDGARENMKNRKLLEVEAERPVSYGSNYMSGGSTDEPVSKAGLPAATTDSKASFEAHVREKFNRMVEAVDKTIEKRIDKLTKELAQKTAELLEVRAAFVQLSQKKQEVQRRERALNRQVDVAVEMIAVLKQRLMESEEELHRKEEEVVTFNHFLEEAAEKEVRGKARLQHFIENLLQRVDLAEKQLEYYQNQKSTEDYSDVHEYMFTDMSSSKKPRCLRGAPHAFYNNADAKPHSLQKGRMHLKKAKEEKSCAHPIKLFYEPVDCSRDVWRPQKKGDVANAARKVNAKSKISKKSKQLY